MFIDAYLIKDFKAFFIHEKTNHRTPTMRFCLNLIFSVCPKFCFQNQKKLLMVVF